MKKNKYQNIMEKIVVTPEMEERILKKLSSFTKLNTEEKKKEIPKWLKPLL